MPKIRVSTHVFVCAIALLVAFGAASTYAQSGAWLDKPLAGWNQDKTMPRGSGSESREAMARRCEAAGSKVSTAASGALGKAGWVPFLHVDRQIVRDDVEVVGGMSAAGPGCEPTTFNLFVFVGGNFAGTLSPAPMTPGRDGAAGAVRIVSPEGMTAEFARYTPADAECCPSSRVRVTYRIERSAGRATLVASEARPVR